MTSPGPDTSPVSGLLCFWETGASLVNAHDRQIGNSEAVGPQIKNVSLTLPRIFPNIL
jgi:hypothetical protein